VAQPLVAGIHAAEHSTMSLRASFPRFLDMEREHRSLFLAARAARKKATGARGSHFVTFARGIAQLIDALVEAIGPAYVRTGVAVTDLEARGGGYRLGLGAGSASEAAAVVLAAPARPPAGLLASVDPEAAAAIGAIARVSTSSVTLV